jgi:hypothetical protein
MRRENRGTEITEDTEGGMMGAMNRARTRAKSKAGGSPEGFLFRAGGILPPAGIMGGDRAASIMVAQEYQQLDKSLDGWYDKEHKHVDG